MEVGKIRWNNRGPVPKLAEAGRSATLRLIVGNEDGSGDSDQEPHSRSDAMPIGTFTAASCYRRSPQFKRRVQLQQQHNQVPHSQPAPEGGILHAHSSADNLLSMAAGHSAEEWSSSDEGDAMLECAICYQRFEDESSKTPRNLQCGHAYCTGCLEKLMDACQVHCPMCSSVTIVETNLVSSLPKNYPLMDIVRESSQLGGRKISRTATTRDTSPMGSLQPPQCPEHDDYLRSYCTKCKTLVCSSCELYGSHRGHPTKFLSEAASIERTRLKDLNTAVFKHKQKMKVGLINVEDTCKAVQEAGGRMEDEVDEFFGDLVALINEKRSTVKTDIRMRTQLRVKSLMEQTKELHDCTERAEAVYSRTNELLRTDDFVLLREAKLMLDLIEGVFTNPPAVLPSARDDLKCTFQDDVKEEVADSIGRASTVTPDVVTIDSSRISIKSYHDGFRISWPEQNFADNLAISYHLQAARGDENYTIIYRGSATKYTWKLDAQPDITYKFRLQVRTTEGVGNWSQPKEARRAEPGMRWHKSWRSIKVELSNDQLEASCIGGGSSHWATFAADKLYEKSSQHYVEIEILSLGKHKSSKERLAVGVVGCGKGGAAAVDWQNSKSPIGEWGEGSASWSFLPFSGVLKSHTIAKAGIPYGENLMIQAGDRIGVLLDLSEGKLVYFCNGNDLGVAFDDLVGRSFLLAVSIRDKIKVRLRFPPPPYSRRKIKIINLRSTN